MKALQIMACLVAAAILMPSAQAGAEIVSGPYLLNITADSVEVLYEGDEGEEPGVVEYGPSPCLDYSTDARRRPLAGEAFVATLTGLEPATLYYYRVVHEGVPGEPGSFTTPVAPGDSFSVVVMGDTRSDHDAHQDVVDAVLANGIPDLVFNTGDLVSTGEDEELWRIFFAIEEELLRNSIFGPCWGNHENGELFNPSKFDKYFTTGGTYSYRYGNAVFIVLNTERGHCKGSFEYGFLEASLIEADANPEIDFKFVFFHKPGVTTKEDRAPEFCVLNGLIDLFEDYGVHAVYTGHNHFYEHGIVNGVHHIVTGGGGAGLYDFIEDYEPEGWTIVAREKSYHFVEVSVDAGQYTSTARRTDLSVIDSFTATIDDHGFPGPTPQDLLRRALGCSQAPSPGPAGADLSALLNLGILLVPAILVRARARKRR